MCVCVCVCVNCDRVSDRVTLVHHQSAQCLVHMVLDLEGCDCVDVHWLYIDVHWPSLNDIMLSSFPGHSLEDCEQIFECSKL